MANIICFFSKKTLFQAYFLRSLFGPKTSDTRDLPPSSSQNGDYPVALPGLVAAAFPSGQGPQKRELARRIPALQTAGIPNLRLEMRHQKCGHFLGVVANKR